MGGNSDHPLHRRDDQERREDQRDDDLYPVDAAYVATWRAFLAAKDADTSHRLRDKLAALHEAWEANPRYRGNATAWQPVFQAWLVETDAARRAELSARLDVLWGLADAASTKREDEL